MGRLRPVPALRRRALARALVRIPPLSEAAVAAAPPCGPADANPRKSSLGGCSGPCGPSGGHLCVGALGFDLEVSSREEISSVYSDVNYPFSSLSSEGRRGDGRLSGSVRIRVFRPNQKKDQQGIKPCLFFKLFTIVLSVLVVCVIVVVVCV